MARETAAADRPDDPTTAAAALEREMVADTRDAMDPRSPESEPGLHRVVIPN